MIDYFVFLIMVYHFQLNIQFVLFLHFFSFKTHVFTSYEINSPTIYL